MLKVPPLFLLALLSASLSAGAEDVEGDEFLSKDDMASEYARKLFSAPSMEDESGLSGEASLGVVLSTGNARNSSANAELTVRYNKRPWRHTVKGSLYLAKDSDVRTAAHYAMNHKLDYFFKQGRYVFNLSSVERDTFANTKVRLADVMGYGHPLLKTEHHTLNGEVGLGFRRTQYVDHTATSNEGVAHFGMRYAGSLSDTSKLSEDLILQSGGDNTFVESVTSLEMEVNKKLSVDLNYTVRANTKVSAGFEKMDTITSVNLVTHF